MKYLICLISCLCLSACTLTMNMVHTQGQADDVVDETTTNTPSTSVSAPVSLT